MGMRLGIMEDDREEVLYVCDECGLEFDTQESLDGHEYESGHSQ